MLPDAIPEAPCSGSDCGAWPRWLSARVTCRIVCRELRPVGPATRFPRSPCAPGLHRRARPDWQARARAASSMPEAVWFALRHVRADMARHLERTATGLRAIAPAARLLPARAERAGRRASGLPAWAAWHRHRPQHQAAQHEHREPAHEPHHPRRPVDEHVRPSRTGYPVPRSSGLSHQSASSFRRATLPSRRRPRQPPLRARPRGRYCRSIAVVRRHRDRLHSPGSAQVRHAARHHDHGRNPLDGEQTEQARVDGDAGVMPAQDESRSAFTVARRPSFARRRASPAASPKSGRPRAAHWRPARRRHREAHEDQDFGRVRTRPGEALRHPRRMAFGR